MKNLDDYLITKFIENRCTEDEYEQVMSHLGSLPDADLQAFLNNHIEKIQNEQVETNIDYVPDFKKLDSKIRHERRKHFFIKRRSVYSIAASLIFMVCLSAAVWYYIGGFKEQPAELSWNEKSTEMGQKSTITLFDGTTITLNADSKLRFPKFYNSSKREVYLEGEAYFEVVHNPQIPFVVHTGSISTSVLGTKFDVKAYAEEHEISVSLVEGRVKVSSEENGPEKEDVILEPSKQFSLNKATGEERVTSFDKDEAIGWKNDILKFDDEPLGQVILELERAYGIKFELKDSCYNDFSVTANFRNASFITILEALKRLTELDYKTETNNNVITKVIFYKK